MMQWFDSMTTWLQGSPHWLALAIFLVACLECLAVAGIIIPGTVLLFTLAVLAGNGYGLGDTVSRQINGLSASGYAFKRTHSPHPPLNL